MENIICKLQPFISSCEVVKDDTVRKHCGELKLCDDESHYSHARTDPNKQRCHLPIYLGAHRLPFDHQLVSVEGTDNI